MKYIEFAENERLSTIVLGMMRISQISEDEMEHKQELVDNQNILHIIDL